MSVRFLQHGSVVKVRSRALLLLVLLLGLFFITGCDNNQNTEFSVIETPSAVRHIFWGDDSNLVANLEIGAISDSGEIFDVTGLEGGLMWSYPIGDQMYVEDLTGITLVLDLDGDSTKGFIGPIHITSNALILEYTFPKASEEGVTEISWFVTPHLVCSYDIESNETDQEAMVWFEYLIFEDPIGDFDLVRNTSAALQDLSGGVEDEQEYVFRGDVSGTLSAFDDERSGTINVLKGQEAKLFVGVSIQYRTFVEGDRIRMGGNSLPNSLDSSERCTLSFGTDSYYTMRPAGDN